jgi:hypothetical protein
MCLLTTMHMELLSEFAALAFRYYKHGTPDGVREPECQMSKLQRQTKVCRTYSRSCRETSVVKTRSMVAWDWSLPSQTFKSHQRLLRSWRPSKVLPKRPKRC